MKKVIVLSMLTCALFASEQNYIEVGAGVVKSKDNFSTESNKRISSLSSAKSENTAFPYVSMFYGYDLNDSTNLYITSQRGDLNIGSRFKDFDFGIKAEVAEEWENPFTKNSNRKKTDVLELGLYAAYALSFNEDHEAEIRYEVSKVEYDKETVLNDLKREGTRHIISFDNIFKTKAFEKNINYLTGFSYEKYNADGKASAYDKFELKMGIMTNITQSLSFGLFANAAKLQYDKFNAMVNKKVDANIYGINATFKCEDALPFENTYLSLSTGYEKEDANHNFYDKESAYAILSAGYKF